VPVFLRYFLTLLLALTSAVAVAEPHPVADFATLPSLEGPALSPKGDKIAARVAINGQQMLAIVNLFDPAAKPAVVGLGENDLNGWRWINDDWLIASIGTLASFEGSPVYVSRVAGVSADGKKINPIDFSGAGQSARIVWTANDGSPRAIIASQHSLYVGEAFWPDAAMYDMSTGKRTQFITAGRDGVMNWIADPAGSVRLGVGADEDKTRLLYRPGNSGIFRTVDTVDARKGEDLILPILLGPGSEAVAIASPGGFDALYEFDLTRLATGKKLWGVDGYDIDAVETDGVTGKPLAIHYTTDRARHHWLDADLAKVQEDLDKATGGNARIVSLNRDHSRMIVHVAGPGQPGVYYFYDAGQGGAMSRIGYANSQLRAEPLSPVKMVRYKAKDGTPIEAVLTLPKGREAKNLPLILMPHGGPRARDSLDYDWWAQFLADRGYAVIQPNYRGSTGYGDTLADAGEGQWGLLMQDDLNDAVDYLAKDGIADPARVCIVGGSYGGYAAMRGAERDGKRFRCAVSYAGVSDMSAMIRYDRQFLNGERTARFFKKQAPDYGAVSPINDANGFSTPILLMHGKKDLRVPVAQSRRMAAALRAAGKPVEYIEQPEGDHFFTRQADRQEFLQKLEEFLVKHNPA
jgi:dipeptidyl aminopeptidase/acylaminoacyl peptidase